MPKKNTVKKLRPVQRGRRPRQQVPKYEGPDMISNQEWQNFIMLQRGEWEKFYKWVEKMKRTDKKTPPEYYDIQLKNFKKKLQEDAFAMKDAFDRAHKEKKGRVGDPSYLMRDYLNQYGPDLKLWNEFDMLEGELRLDPKEQERRQWDKLFWEMQQYHKKLEEDRPLTPEERKEQEKYLWDVRNNPQQQQQQNIWAQVKKPV